MEINKDRMIWDGKRYHSLTYDIQREYGQKIYKLSLDGGMSCPNRDGTIWTGGCCLANQQI